MAKIGGYKIIDFNDYPFVMKLSNSKKKGDPNTGNAATGVIPGIYEALEGNYRRACLFSGFKIGGIEYADFFGEPKIDGDNFVIDTTFGYHFVIEDTDEVTITASGSTMSPTAYVHDAEESLEATSPTTAQFNALVDAFNSLINGMQDSGLMSGK